MLKLIKKMYCNCSNTLLVPECTDNIFIGTATPSTEYWVHFNNESSGYNAMQVITSDISGNIIIDTTTPAKSYYNSASTYIVYITLPNSEVKENITLDAVIHTCFVVKFEKINTDAIFTTWNLEYDS